MATSPFPLPSSPAATNRARFTRIRSIAVREDSSFNPAALVNHGSKMTTDANPMIVHLEKTKERIKKMFNGDELSISSYDTAWVAMVPSFNSQEDPRFPQCVNWLLDNQLCDGSWGLSHRHQFLLRDTISSTLACVLALKRWGVGEEKINKGLRFIELNFTSATDDEKQLSPVGFEIIFPGMIEYAKDLNLDIPIKPGDVNAMIHKRNLELKRAQETNCKGREAYMAYVSEGLGKLQDWEMVMKYQRKNGSLFNSPSTTAAALIHLPIFNCFNYLDSILKKFGNAVPTVYPLDIYTRLWMVDMLERMGIDWHFMKEIGNVLDETYRRWQQTDEEIFLDTATCAMAFQILRFHGYDVSSEPVSQFPDEDHYSSSLCSHMKDTRAALELFRASELKYSDEPTLEKQSLRLSLFLRQELSCGRKVSDHVIQEVNDALQFPFHANLGRLKNRSSIENYNVVDMRMLKTSYRSSIFGNKYFLDLAVEDFNMCQSIHLEELKQLERWVVDNKLDQLPFARKKLAYCYFSAAASLVPPHLSDARISWAKNGVLTTVVDDFFDVGGSEEELANLIYLLEKWDVNVDTDCSSEQVRIVFSALRSTICEIGDKALAWQERNVTSHIIEIWLDLVRSMWREAEWVRTKSLPTVDEYMENGYVSFALGPIVLPALYLVGPKLSEEAVGSIEFHNLFKFMSTCGRLLNDIQTVEREAKEGKLNAVLLRMVHSNGVITKEENVKEMRDVGEQTRRELLRMVLQNEGSVVPRACKDLFWKMSKVVHFFYIKDDGFSSHELVNVVKELIHQPIVLQS